ncbi:MAG: hypothetical protein KA354_20660 [Phycisphaerae bacterium]|nr:hypothetical protein [Phycisphaerae bacterium]
MPRSSSSCPPGSVFRILMLPMVAGLLAAVSCAGQQAGAFWYTLGVVKPPKKAVSYELPRKPVLILVDDDRDLAQPRQICDLLVDALAQELREQDLVDRVTTNEELAKVRQSEPNFDKRGAREVGRLVKADIVIWLNISRYSLPDELDWSGVPAYFGASVKIVNAQAERRDDVRLWPTTTEGKIVEVEVSPHNIRRCKTVKEAQQVMAESLATEIARLFYEYQEES